jgi:hypothetical protein
VLLDRQTRSAPRIALQLLGALLLLGGWSLALAAPGADDPIVSRSAPDRAHSSRAALLNTALNTALPALAAPKMPRPSLGLNEPRSLAMESRDPPVAVSNDQAAGKHPPGVLAIQWRESREIVNADIVGLVRNYRRDGLPIVHLYQSNQSVLAVGLNNHGVPGIYFTRHIGG